MVLDAPLLAPPARVGRIGPRHRNAKADSLWAVAAALLFAGQQLAVAVFVDDGLSGVFRRSAVLTGSGALVLVAFHFRRFLAAWLIALGVAMNLAPMVAHGGVMPVSFELIAASGAFPGVTTDHIGETYGRSKDIVLRQDDLRLAPLTDRYFVSLPGYKPNIYSAGDFVLFGGILVAAAECLALAIRPAWRIERLAPRWLASFPSAFHGMPRCRSDRDAHPG